MAQPSPRAVVSSLSIGAIPSSLVSPQTPPSLRKYKLESLFSGHLRDQSVCPVYVARCPYLRGCLCMKIMFVSVRTVESVLYIS